MWAALTLDVRHTLWPNERISFVGFQILMRLKWAGGALRICDYSTRWRNSMASVYGGKKVEQNLAKEL